mmetsp:Transcript_49684/g.118241  ORF Transcript_49684/g.118241 Transcript_49684/m.118241 type:complete len:220 (+) Transcript_49684:43-702(+)
MLQRPLDRCSPQRLSGVLPRPRIKRELAWNRPAKSFPEAGLTHTVLTHETVLFPGFALHLVLHRHASPPPGVFIVSRGTGAAVPNLARRALLAAVVAAVVAPLGLFQPRRGVVGRGVAGRVGTLPIPFRAPAFDMPPAGHEHHARVSLVLSARLGHRRGPAHCHQCVAPHHALGPAAARHRRRRGRGRVEPRVPARRRRAPGVVLVQLARRVGARRRRA